MTTARLANKLGLQQLKVWEGDLLYKYGKTFYELQARNLEKKPFDLGALKNKVVLISNIASKSSWSSANFDKLANLHTKYRGQLQILAFPSNAFGKEPGHANDIREFAKSFGARFHLMEMAGINGPESHEIFRALKKATNTENIDITDDYEAKFLVAREGQHVERFSNAQDPMLLVPFIDRLVGEVEPPEEDSRDEENLTKSPASYVNTG